MSGEIMGNGKTNLRVEYKKKQYNTKKTAVVVRSGPEKIREIDEDSKNRIFETEKLKSVVIIEEL